MHVVLCKMQVSESARNRDYEITQKLMIPLELLPPAWSPCFPSDGVTRGQVPHVLPPICRAFRLGLVCELLSYQVLLKDGHSTKGVLIAVVARDVQVIYFNLR